MKKKTRKKTTSLDEAHEWVSQAITYSDAGDYERAYEAYQRALELEPTSVSLNHNWAISALKQGDRLKTAECVNRLMNAAPEDWRTSMVQAYLAELSNEIQSGWEFSQRAYAQAHSKGNYEDLVAATPDVLLFAYRNRLQNQLGEIIDQVFEKGAFSESILNALRKLFGKPSDRAVDYTVLIEGDFPNPAFPNSSRYVRSFRVLAESKGQACRMALDFEARCGEKGLRIISVEKKSEPCEENLGVWWRLDAQNHIAGCLKRCTRREPRPQIRLIKVEGVQFEDMFGS